MTKFVRFLLHPGALAARRHARLGPVRILVLLSLGFLVSCASDRRAASCEGCLLIEESGPVADVALADRLFVDSIENNDPVAAAVAAELRARHDGGEGVPEVERGAYHSTYMFEAALLLAAEDETAKAAVKERMSRAGRNRVGGPYKKFIRLPVGESITLSEEFSPQRVSAVYVRGAKAESRVELHILNQEGKPVCMRREALSTQFCTWRFETRHRADIILVNRGEADDEFEVFAN